MSKYERFRITTVNEHGYVHCKIYDALKNITVHCDVNEVNSEIEELINNS